jgi:hypothetical protein
MHKYNTDSHVMKEHCIPDGIFEYNRVHHRMPAELDHDSFAMKLLDVWQRLHKNVLPLHHVVYLPLIST